MQKQIEWIFISWHYSLRWDSMSTYIFLLIDIFGRLIILIFLFMSFCPIKVLRQDRYFMVWPESKVRRRKLSTLVVIGTNCHILAIFVKFFETFKNCTLRNEFRFLSILTITQSPKFSFEKYWSKSNFNLTI